MKTSKHLLLALISPLALFAQGDCSPGSAMGISENNNVRFTLLNSGDMWSNISTYEAGYEVPKDSGIHPIYSGALWMGGLDNEGQIHTAAMTYRQNGIDYWPGPLNAQAETEADNCFDFDLFYTVKRSDVIAHIENWENEDYILAPSIANWPGNRPDNINETFAPYADVNENGTYDPENGDYPNFDIHNEGLDCQGDVLMGDEVVWWVFNDKGNIHTETLGAPFGFEIQAQAFSFHTDDALNNTTFYRYKIINRSETQYTNSYLGQWVDIDLGYYNDDFIGCDVGRNMGYGYNGDLIDEGGYGENPPAIGIDFLQGSAAELGDNYDNDNDGEIDEDGEQILMSKFVYYENSNNSTFGNPYEAADFYNYLQGKWMSGNSITYGASGTAPENPNCNYLYPGDTDPNFEEAWHENSDIKIAGDRKILMSMGPMDFFPKEAKYISMAVIWSRSIENETSSVDLLKLDSDFVQNHFDNCFEGIYNVPLSTNEYALAPIETSPNPANNQLKISWENPNNEMDLFLYNMDGQLVYQEKHQNGTVLNTSRFPSGTYHLCLTKGNKEIRSEKIIIQH